MIDYSDFASSGAVFKFFEEIAKIPHASGNTKKIADYLTQFASERGLTCHRDTSDNVIIKKPATKGYEHKPTVILQGHTDMVPAVAEGHTHDFETDELKLYRDGDFLRAEGTTLGGDDGIALAYMLAILDSSDTEHPAIEAVFTSDEEIGLIGAGQIDEKLLSGRMMINIDSDAEGIFTVGCAGGLRMDIKLPAVRDIVGGSYYMLTLCGLMGGHSGAEIDKGRINAIKALTEALSEIPSLRICSIKGGNADNAIPSSASCVFTAGVKSAGEILGYASRVKEKYEDKEPGMSFELKALPSATLPFTEDSTRKIINLISEEPNGIVAMSEDIPGLVETSLNLGIVGSSSSDVTISFSLRSSVGAAKAALRKKVRNIAEKFGCEITEHGEYPAWEYRKESRLRDVMCEIYEKCYGKEPVVVAIHAGLECGIFAGKLPGLDCVSIGPDNYDIHTPQERLSLSSADRVYSYLLRVLKEI